MLSTEKPAIRDTSFDNERLVAVGVDVILLSDLRSKVTHRLLSQPERINFFMLMLVTSGHGRHTVDFVDYPLCKGKLIFVRPGQVQQWHVNHPMEAILTLIMPSALPHRRGFIQPHEIELLAFDVWNTQLQLTQTDDEQIHSGLLRLKSDHDSFDASNLDVSLIRHELITLLLRIAKIQQTGNYSPTLIARPLYRLFLKELEANFHKQHSINYYASFLGCSESTLSRACLNAVGYAGKQVIDRRIALEAQRMLAHSSSTIADIAAYLGFSEATNFVKFFRRMIRETPSAFRSRMTGVMNVKS
jgi:AraC-like DNA-binding protein